MREERQQRNGTEDEKEEDVGYGWGEHRGSMEDVWKTCGRRVDSTNEVDKGVRAGYSWLWCYCILFVV